MSEPDAKKQPRLIWIDLEMSGLEPEEEVILEVAAIVTDGELVELDEGIEMVVKQPDSVLDGMDDWCTRQHGLSGLTDEVKANLKTAVAAFKSEWNATHAVVAE